MDVLTPEQRRKNMQAIKSKNTKMEVLLAKSLWKLGYRYRKNNKNVFGKPDITFKKYKIAVFVDGEYFHGKDWENEKFRIKTNRDFWWKKIEENIKRDQQVNQQLMLEGWKVIRFWSKEVRKNLELCILRIEEALTERRNAAMCSNLGLTVNFINWGMSLRCSPGRAIRSKSSLRSGLSTSIPHALLAAY
jgi:DNA mismatch endonuclease (patch repair protein)